MNDQADELDRILRLERDQERENWARIELCLVNGLSCAAATYVVDVGLTEKVPGILYELWEERRLGGDLKSAVADVWIHNESPLRGLGQRRWLELFKTAGFVVRRSPTVIDAEQV